LWSAKRRINSLNANDPVGKRAKLRDRADECRRLAALVTDQAGRASYLQLADAYEALAKQEEALSRV